MCAAPVAYPALGQHWRDLDILARGANRLCARDPEHADRCLKFELAAQERTRVGMRARMRRAFARVLPALGENATEWRAWRRLRARIGTPVREVFAQCEAIVATRWGRALRCELVRQSDGTPARSLYSHLFDGTACTADALCAEVDRIEAWLLRHRVPLFDLNAGNFVVGGSAAQPRLICIDAKSVLAGKEILPISRWSATLMQRKIGRRAERLRQRIRHALAEPARPH